MNSAHALGSSVLSCFSTALKLKALQHLGSVETEDWTQNSVWYQALFFLFLIRLSLLLSTSFLQILADQPNNKKFVL